MVLHHQHLEAFVVILKMLHDFSSILRVVVLSFDKPQKGPSLLAGAGKHRMQDAADHAAHRGAQDQRKPALRHIQL